MGELRKIDREMLEQARAAPIPELPAGESTRVPDSARGIPLSRLSDSFENFDLKLNPGLKTALDLCKKVAAGKAWCAFLAGEFGTGKTHLAIAALNAWISREKNGYFWKVPDFLEYARHLAYGEGQGLDAALNGYRSGRCLVVFDDLGAENRTDWAGEQLYRVLDSRYDLRLPTILTTNQARNRIDGRLLSRYREGLVVCEGTDVRA